MRADRCGIEPAAILDAASESIIVTGANLEPPGPNIVYVNPAFERMTGWMADEIVGKSPRLLQGVKTDHSVFQDMHDALRRGDRWEGQAVNYRKNGAEFVMEWSITPLKDARGRTTQFVAVQRDVTARVEADPRIAEAREAAREADRKKANLARYFSPKMVEILAQTDRPLGRVRRQEKAVMFIDIVGFTAISEILTPERVGRSCEVILSQDVESDLRLRRLDRKVCWRCTHGAVRCSGAGQARCDERLSGRAWHDGRTGSLECQACRLRPRSHRCGHKRPFRDRLLGDIGTRESMTFTAIGDTVNTASRMQALCREFKRRLVVSEPLVDRVRQESGNDEVALAHLFDAGTHRLRGRSQKIQSGRRAPTWPAVTTLLAGKQWSAIERRGQVADPPQRRESTLGE